MIYEERKYPEPLIRTFNRCILAISVFIVLWMPLLSGQEPRLGQGLEFRLRVLNPSQIAGEPVFVEVRWSNTGKNPVSIRMPTMYGSTGIAYKRDADDSFKSVPLFPGEFEIDVGVRSNEQVVLKPGEFLEDYGVFAYFGMETGYETGEFTIKAESFGYFSNEGKITVDPPDDKDLFQLFVDENVLAAIQGWRPDQRAIERLEEVANSGGDSRYREIAAFYLDRVKSEEERHRMNGSYYRSSDYNPVSLSDGASKAAQESTAPGSENLLEVDASALSEKRSTDFSDNEDVPGASKNVPIWIYVIILGVVFVLGVCIWLVKRG